VDGEVLRDDQWEKLRAFVPGGRKGKRGPRSDGRRFFDALLCACELDEAEKGCGEFVVSRGNAAPLFEL
jgi:hypothetical protein